MKINHNPDSMKRLFEFADFGDVGINRLRIGLNDGHIALPINIEVRGTDIEGLVWLSREEAEAVILALMLALKELD